MKPTYEHRSISGKNENVFGRRSGSLVFVLVLFGGMVLSASALLPVNATSTVNSNLLNNFAIKPFLPGGSYSTSGPIQCSSHGELTNESACWPMGIADYGVNPSNDHTYTYRTETFEASITIDSINMGANNCGYPCGGGEDVMTLQQNTVANISVGGIHQTYWTQDVPFLFYYPSTHSYSVIPLDNVWNFSGIFNVGGPMTDISGNLNGQCVFDGGAPEYYYCEAPSVSNLHLPLTIGTKMTVYEQCISGVCSNYVTFYMDILHGSTLVYSNTFDKVQFTNGKPENKPYFYVEPCLPTVPFNSTTFGTCSIGSKVAPIGLPWDAEWIVGGPADGSQVIINHISATMSESFLNSTTGEFQSVPHAWSNGWDTAEGSGNVHITSPGGPPTAVLNTGKDDVDAGLW
jgi:hypothetical protein